MTGIVFSGLDFDMDDPVEDGYRLQARVDGCDWGNGEAVIESITSQLLDGDIETVTRWGNRVATIEVRIDALRSVVPGQSLALGEKAIEQACQFDGWAELVLTSDLEGAEPSVVEVVAAFPTPLMDYRSEFNYQERTYVLTLHARPFVRSVEPVTIEAPQVIGSTTTTVDDGTSTTGWSLLGDSASAPAAQKNLIDPDAWAASSNAGTPTGNTSASTGLKWSPSGSGNSYVSSNLMTVVAGTAYNVAISLKVNDSGITRTMGLRWRWYQADGTTQVGSDKVTSASIAAGGFRAKAWTVTAPAGAARLRIFPYVAASSSSNDVTIRYVSARAASELPQGYFDGATADTAAITYSWDGTASQSTATGTWSSPTLAIVSGRVKGTVFGRTSASVSRAGTIDTSTLNYLRVKGTATPAADGKITVADNGLGLTPIAYSYNPGSGAFDVVILRPEGFATVDVTFSRASAASQPSTTAGTFVAVDQVEITDNPFALGKVQSRQVTVFGSQRTDLSLNVLGLDEAGTTPVGLGEQVLVHTAAKGDDGRAKFLDCRAAAALGGTSDATAVSGVYNALSTTASPTSFTFTAGTLLTGNYLAVGRVRTTTVGATDLMLRAYVDPSTGDNVYDPAGGGWRTAALTCVTSGAVWPQVDEDAWVLLPLGLLRLPPADLEDDAATITVQVARGSNGVDLDDVFLLNADVGQASLMLTGLASGSYSAVRLDAATVDSPQASAWVGVANGTMMADPARWVGEQHAASPGLLQIATVTPGSATSRVSAQYYRRYLHHVVDEGA